MRFKVKEGNKITVEMKSGTVFAGGEVTEVDENGFWAVFADEPEREDYFAFVELTEVRVDG